MNGAVCHGDDVYLELVVKPFVSVMFGYSSTGNQRLSCKSVVMIHGGHQSNIMISNRFRKTFR